MHPSFRRHALRPAARGAGLLLLAAASLACGRPFEPAVPPGFVELEDRYGSDEHRATTAEGVVLGVRVLPNEPKGELSFWTQVVEQQMRGSAGYALLETRAVVNRAGKEGKLLLFGVDENREPYLYYLAIFVDGDRIFLLEAGGQKADMDRRKSQVEWSIRNFLPR